MYQLHCNLPLWWCHSHREPPWQCWKENNAWLYCKLGSFGHKFGHICSLLAYLVVGSCDSLTVCTEAGTFFPMDTRALNEDILLNVSLIFLLQINLFDTEQKMAILTCRYVMHSVHPLVCCESTYVQRCSSAGRKWDYVTLFNGGTPAT